MEGSAGGVGGESKLRKICRLLEVFERERHYKVLLT